MQAARTSDLFAEGDVAAVEDDGDAVQRHRAADLLQVPCPREVVVGRITRELFGGGGMWFPPERLGSHASAVPAALAARKEVLSS